MRSSTKPWRTRCRVSTACCSTRLDRHEAHVGPSHRLADRLGVVAVVLAALAIRRDELRRHQPHRVAERRKLPRPLVRAGARLHADQARRQLRDECDAAASRRTVLRSTITPAASTPCSEKTFFAKSIPTVVTLLMDFPSRVEIEHAIHFNLGTSMPSLGTGKSLTFVRRHRVSTSRIGLVPLEPDGERLVAYLERRTPWDS